MVALCSVFSFLDGRNFKIRLLTSSNHSLSPDLEIWSIFSPRLCRWIWISWQNKSHGPDGPSDGSGSLHLCGKKGGPEGWRCVIHLSGSYICGFLLKCKHSCSPNCFSSSDNIQRPRGTLLRATWRPPPELSGLWCVLRNESIDCSLGADKSNKTVSNSMICVFSQKQP